jgi:hypothetical protein
LPDSDDLQGGWHERRDPRMVAQALSGADLELPTSPGSDRFRGQVPRR